MARLHGVKCEHGVTGTGLRRTRDVPLELQGPRLAMGSHSLTGGPEFSAAFGFVLGNTSARSCSREALGPHLRGVVVHG
jgi:hypothetical protein